MIKETKNYLERLCYYFMLLCISLNSPAMYAAEDEIAAGRVVAVSGQVSAISSSGDTRSLRRGRELFEGDTIVTQPAAFAQIRMTDSAIVSLKESTRFEIVSYSFSDGQDTNNDVINMRLIEGGFRTITGAIGTQNRDAYNVETEFSNIGIRGTDHEAVIDGILYVGVYNGATNLENSGGELPLGLRADFDFGLARNDQTPPEGLLLQPFQLGQIPVLSVADLDQAEDGDEEG
ncbi:MAG: hypothetical protein ACJATW_002806, partial [Glaciecola sp.]